MILKRFSIKNLFSFKEAEISLDNRGLVLVTGWDEDRRRSNGAGKSNLSSKALLWTMFGKVPHDISMSGVVSRFSRGLSQGMIEFIAEDDRSYKIIRTRDEARTRLVLLNGHGVDISGRDIRDTQKKINLLFGRSFEIFLQTDFFGQGRLMNYVSAPPAIQKEILESILNIDSFNEAALRAKEYISRIEGFLKPLENELMEITGSLRETNDQIKELTMNYNSFEAHREVRISGLEGIKSSTERLSNLRLEHSRIQDSKIRLRELEEKIKEFPTTDPTLAGRVSTLAQELSILYGKIHSKCSECGQSITVPNVEELTVSYNKKWKNYHIMLEEHEKQVNASKYIETIQTEINNLRDHIKNEQEIYKQIVQIEYIDNEVLRIRTEENPFTLLKQTALSKANSLSKRLTAHKNKVDRLKEELDHLSFWQGVYGKELRNTILSKACPFLDERAVYHLNNLGCEHLRCKFSTVKQLESGDLRDDFNVTVSNIEGGESYGALSGGEQQMVNFAVGLALSDLATINVNSISNILVLDEPFSMLDDTNSEAVVNYITTELSKTKSTVLLISNEEYLKSLISNRINIIKKDGISYVGDTI